MKNALSYIIVIPAFLGVALMWTPWVIWFLPLVLTVVYFLLLKPDWYFQSFMFLVCIASACTGLWALLLLNVIGPNLPSSLQWFLTLHIDPHSQPIIIGRYYIGGMDAGEFLGYIALVSIGGFIMLTIFIAMKTIAIVSSPTKRIWIFRFSVITIIGGWTFLVYTFFHEYWILFGFISYMVGIGFLMNNVDPREELKE